MSMQIIILKGTTFRGTKYYEDTRMDVSEDYAKQMLRHGVAVAPDKPSAIADRFVEVLRSWLAPEEFAEMKRRNESEPEYADGRACASQDFCDANMAMQEAFESVMGRICDGDNEVDCMVWNTAWELARMRALGDQ
jgi:hypothetical protein